MKNESNMDLDLNLLQYKDYLKVKVGEDQREIFDEVRKKYLLLIPEEFVRQLFIQFLLKAQHISRGRIAVEKKISNRKMEKRFDILIFDKSGQPWMIVECKSAEVKLNQSALDQIGYYNTMIRAPYLWITNGRQNLGFEIDLENGSFKALAIFPSI